MPKVADGVRDMTRLVTSRLHSMIFDDFSDVLFAFAERNGAFLCAGA